MNETGAEFLQNQRINTLKRVDPENSEHIAEAHRMDELSASDGLLNEGASPETLEADEFDRWTHAGDSPKNMWRQLDLIVPPETGVAIGFANSYRMNPDLLAVIRTDGKIAQQVSASGTTAEKVQIDEMQWFIPEKHKAAQERSLRQHISSRFKEGTDLIVVWTDDEHRPDELEALRVLGFKDGPTAHYEGEERLSTSHYLDRASFFGAGADRIDASQQ